MKKVILLFFVLFLVSSASQAQISTPKLKKFNVGLFMGLGGESGPNLNLVPVLNLSYRGTILTAGVDPNSNINIGIIQDIMPVSVSFYNVRWIASGFYSQGKSDRYYSKDSDYKMYAVLTGLRFNFGSRFFSNAQLGVSFTGYKTPGHEDFSEVLPFVEFGIGMNLFKTFEAKQKPPTTSVTE